MDINISAKSIQNSDGVEVRDANIQITNGYTTETDGVSKRPGLSLAKSLGNSRPVTSLFWWPHKPFCIASLGPYLYRLDYGGSLTATELTGSAYLLNGPRPTYAVAELSNVVTLFAANGGKIGYTDGTTAYAEIADADAPTQVTHVAYLDFYLLANSLNSNRWYFSDVRAPGTWSSLSYKEASSDPDVIQALHVMNREIYLFGKKSIEVWQNTGSTFTFERVDGGFIESGLLAPYSVISQENNFTWLDSNRRVVQFDGRSVTPISKSNSFAKKIQALGNISDCYGESLEIAGQSFLVFHFPSANATYVYNRTSDDWAVWDKWNSETATSDRWMSNCTTFCPDWNLHLAGDKSNGNIYFVSPDYVNDDSTPIRFEILTGHLDHSTLRTKRSDELRFRARRGYNGASNPFMHVKWKDNNRTGWSNGRQISLGSSGETDIVRRIQRSGTYRTRQWSFSTTANVPVSISAVEEDITVMR